MSRLTTTPQLPAPLAADAVPVIFGGTAWVYGDWVQFFAATTADDTAIAGIALYDPVFGWTGEQAEFEFGIGAEGEEVAIGHIRISGPSSGNAGPTSYKIPYPISGIPLGTRVCVRVRRSLAIGFTYGVTVLYYNDLDSDQAVPYTLATLTSIPSGANSVSVTPDTTPWTNSAWVECDPEVGDDTYIVAIAPGAVPGEVDIEIDVGVGAAAAEVTQTTFRMGNYGGGRLNFANLPGMLPIASGSRVATRLRKSGTSDSITPVAFLAYVGPLAAPATLIIEKVTDPPGSEQAFDYTTTGGLSPDTFSLTDGQQQTYTDLEPGTYGVEETVPTGWTLTSVVVSNGDDPDAITLGPGESVTVTFTNTQNPATATLIVEKVVLVGDPDQEFPFEAGPGLTPGTFVLTHGEQQIFLDVAPGTYSVEEIVPDGWILVSVEVSNGDDPTAITIEAGDTITVTFTDTLDVPEGEGCPLTLEPGPSSGGGFGCVSDVTPDETTLLASSALLASSSSLASGLEV